MIRLATVTLLLILCCLQNQYFSALAFLIQPQKQLCAHRSSRSSLLGRQEQEEEWLRKRKEMEEEKKEWERKIRAKNEEKQKRGRVELEETETRSATNSRLKKSNKSQTNRKDKSKDLSRLNKIKVKQNDQKDKSDNSEKPNDDDKEDDDASSCSHFVSKDAVTFAQAHSAELIALAGPKFDGDLLGVGGLDDVIAEIKRRVWTPLAAPPAVMAELGITPVRGVMLYGSSGCGKTLLARTIGNLLSPARPLTVVSGPQLMDKFVGSSEKNLRELFDNPSGVYDPYRISGGKGMDKSALHVIVLDEFDAMARTRSGPEADSSAAGVARDSVVNQILAKMDGIDPLPVPTLVIAMTNRPNLIDPALLRPGRFEVQIEVPPPRTTLARMSILNVHMNCMQEAGRLEVRDAPRDGYVSPQCAEQASMTYQELLTYLAELCEGFSGASLAAIPRAAASRALERAVTQYSSDLYDNLQNKGKQDAIAMFDCVVTVEDLDCAVQDVRRSATTLEQSLNTSASQETTTNGAEKAFAVNGGSL